MSQPAAFISAPKKPPELEHAIGVEMEFSSGVDVGNATVDSSTAMFTMEETMGLTLASDQSVQLEVADGASIKMTSEVRNIVVSDFAASLITVPK